MTCCRSRNFLGIIAAGTFDVECMKSSVIISLFCRGLFSVVGVVETTKVSSTESQQISADARRRDWRGFDLSRWLFCFDVFLFHSYLGVFSENTAINFVGIYSCRNFEILPCFRIPGGVTLCSMSSRSD